MSESRLHKKLIARPRHQGDVDRSRHRLNYSRVRVNREDLDYDLDSDPDSDPGVDPTPSVRKSGPTRLDKGMSIRGKAFADLLGPLKGYLRKQIGRPWDTVYSELCSKMDRRSVIGNHLFEHVDAYVHPSNDVTFTPEGEPYSIRFGRRLGEAIRPALAYVDPRDGIIKAVKRIKPQPSTLFDLPPLVKKVQVKDAFGVKSSAFEGFDQIEGIWYKVRFTREWNEVSQRWDVRYSVKRHLTKREMKEHGLKSHEPFNG